MEKQEYISKQNDLFEKWKIARPEYEGDDFWFCLDGIVSPDVNYDDWLSQTPKILFLAKEDWSGWNPAINKFNVKFRFGMNIARWRFLLIELFKDPTSILEYPHCNLDIIGSELTDIAVVEVKKKTEDGKTTSQYPEIHSYAKSDKDFLREQIELINPDIIFCCGTVDFYDVIYEDEQYEISSLIKVDGYECWKHYNRLVIDFCHPSMRASPKEKFSILQNMIKTGTVYKNFNWG